MSLYDKASLVLIPSGTKAGKVYSQKPTSGDGDFDFTRSSYATRVNSQGLIEKERSNLLLQSNNFDTTWTPHSSIDSVTSGQTGYDGSSDAWLVTKTAIDFSHINQEIASSGLLTYSVYAKANTLSAATLYVGGGSATRYVKFNLSNGSVITTANIITSNAVDVGSGWYRLSITFDDTISRVRIYPDFSETSAGSIYIQDAQLEQGLVATDVIETTTSVVYEGITDNVPRLDYDGDCPSLLLEPQRTNLVTDSEYFDGSFWQLGTNSTLSFVSDLNPSGTQGCYRLQNPASSSTYLASDSLGVISNDSVFSVYVKSNTGSNQNFGLYTSTENMFAFTATTEWQRFQIDAPSEFYQVGINNQNDAYSNDILIYGAQLEQGSYATSYIPTYGTSVTRNQDSPSYLDVTPFTGSAYTIFLDYKDAQRGSPNTGNWMYLYNTSNQLLTYVYGGTLMIHSTSGEDYSSFPFGDAKIAFAYDGTNVKYFLNGTLVKTVTASTRWDLEAEQYWIYNTPFGNSTSTISYNSFVIFPEALTDQQCIDLTS